MTENEFVQKMIPLALNAEQRFGYLACVLVGQSIIETGYGQTDLAQEGKYNVLGMKKELLNDTWTSDYWHGGTHTKVTPEWTPDGEEIHITDVFRTYDSKDPAELIREVRIRGYCTNPEYDRYVMSLIDKWDLMKISDDGRCVYLVVT